MFASSLISSKVAPVAHSGSHFASGAHTAVWQLLPQLLPPLLLLLVKTKPWTPSAATSWSFHFCCCWNAATSTFVSLPPSQRPKKSELSGWQLSTRKNFSDEVHKLFLRHPDHLETILTIRKLSRQSGSFPGYPGTFQVSGTFPGYSETFRKLSRLS